MQTSSILRQMLRIIDNFHLGAVPELVGQIVGFNIHLLLAKLCKRILLTTAELDNAFGRIGRSGWEL